MVKKGIAILAIALALSAPTAAWAKSKLGFGVEVTASGVFSPVLQRLKVSTVVPGSPAAAAGLKAGDYIIEANGQAIEGAPAMQVAGKLKNIAPGEHLRLKLKRGPELVTADIIAGR